MKNNLQFISFNSWRRTLVFTLLTSLVLFSQSCFAQEEQTCANQKNSVKIEAYKKALTELEKGTLLIEFPSYKKQVEAYDQLLKDDDLTESNRSRIIKLRQSRIDEHREWVGHVLQAFEEYYSFSDVRAYVRSDREKVGKDPNIWLNDNAEKITLPPLTQYYILSDGQTATQDLSAYFFIDKEFKPLCSPAPHYFRLNTFRTLWSFGAEADKVKAEQLAKRAQRAFINGKVRYQL